MTKVAEACTRAIRLMQMGAAVQDKKTQLTSGRKMNARQARRKKHYVNEVQRLAPKFKPSFWQIKKHTQPSINPTPAK